MLSFLISSALIASFEVTVMFVIFKPVIFLQLHIRKMTINSLFWCLFCKAETNLHITLVTLLLSLGISLYGEKAISSPPGQRSSLRRSKPNPSPQTSKMKSFTAVVNGFQLLTIIARISILDVYGGPTYAFASSVFSPHRLDKKLSYITEV